MKPSDLISSEQKPTVLGGRKGRKPKEVVNESMPVRPPKIDLPEELSIAEKLELLSVKYQGAEVQKCRVIREKKPRTTAE